MNYAYLVSLRTYIWKSPLSTAVPLSWPGAREGDADSPGEREHRGREDLEGGVVVLGVSTLFAHVASLETYSHHAEPWSSSGASLFQIILDQIDPNLVEIHLLSSLFLIWVPLVIK